MNLGRKESKHERETEKELVSEKKRAHPGTRGE